MVSLSSAVQASVFFWHLNHCMETRNLNQILTASVRGTDLIVLFTSQLLLILIFLQVLNFL